VDGLVRDVRNHDSRCSSGRVVGASDILARLQVRYPEVQVVFADSRRFAEEWTYRFLAAALGDAPA